jgi:hypothetical protein
MPSESRYRIDKFRVPTAAHAEFMERVAFIDRFLGSIDGCLSHGVYERQLESGEWAVVTIAHWRSPEAMASAQSLAAAEYAKWGFDPREFIKKHGVEADIGTYTEAE